MNWAVKTPVYGDIIRTKVQFYHHYGIFVSPEQVIQFGLPNDPLQGADTIRVLSSDIYTFLQGGELEVAQPDRAEKKTMYSPAEIVDRAAQRLGQDGYDILHNNCEHFVNECAFGKHESAFLQDVRQKLREKLNRR